MSVIGTSQKIPTYEYGDFVSMGYKLKVAVLADNPDLPAYIEEKRKEGCTVKLVELKKDEDAPSVVDVWVRDWIV